MKRGRLPDLFGGFEAVEFWHDQIHEYQVGSVVGGQFNGTLSVFSFTNFKAEGSEQVEEQGSVFYCVVYDEYVFGMTLEADGQSFVLRYCFGFGCTFDFSEVCIKKETAAFAGFTFHLYLSAHQTNDLLTDRPSQSRAFCFLFGITCLFEGFEYCGCFFL